MATSNGARERFNAWNQGDPRGILADVPIKFNTESITRDLAKGVGSMAAAFAAKRQALLNAQAEAAKTLTEHQNKLAEDAAKATVEGEQERLTKGYLGEVKTEGNVRYGRQGGQQNYTELGKAEPSRSVNTSIVVGGRGDTPGDKVTAHDQDILHGRLMGGNMAVRISRRVPGSKVTTDPDGYPVVDIGAAIISDAERAAMSAGDNAIAMAVNPTKIDDALAMLQAARDTIAATDTVKTGFFHQGQKVVPDVAAQTRAMGLLDDYAVELRAQKERIKVVPAARWSGLYGNGGQRKDVNDLLE
jgi:hypothetical protein